MRRYTRAVAGPHTKHFDPFDRFCRAHIVINRHTQTTLHMHRKATFYDVHCDRPKRDNYIYTWLGSRVVSVLYSGAEGHGFK